WMRNFDSANFDCVSNAVSRSILVFLTFYAAMIAQLSFAEELAPGLVREFFDIGKPMRDFPVLAPDTEPTSKGVDSVIHFSPSTNAFPGTDSKTDFFIRWSGVIKIPHSGVYEFFLGSDGGSRLTMDGKEVVNKGGYLPVSDAYGKIDLSAGE